MNKKLALCTDGSRLPRAALRLLSSSQRTYLDEFRFVRAEGGRIQGWYAGELLSVWDGEGWQLPTKDEIEKAWLTGSPFLANGDARGYKRPPCGCMGD